MSLCQNASYRISVGAGHNLLNRVACLSQKFAGANFWGRTLLKCGRILVQGLTRRQVACSQAPRYVPEMERSPPIEDDETWFGDRRVETSEKPRLVRGVFERVAGRYDLMNDLMSGGIHRLWKAAMIDWLAPRPGQLLLDVAGGTGDIAQRFLAKAGTGARVVVCDLTPAMLAVGRDRAIDRGIIAGIDWVAGDAQALPLGRPQRRCLYHRLRAAQCRRDRQGPGRGAPGAEARRALPLPGVQPGGAAPAQAALRSLFLPRPALDGAARGGRPRRLCLSGGKHPPLPGPAGAGRRAWRPPGSSGRAIAISPAASRPSIPPGGSEAVCSAPAATSPGSPPSRGPSPAMAPWRPSCSRSRAPGWRLPSCCWPGSFPARRRPAGRASAWPAP